VVKKSVTQLLTVDLKRAPFKVVGLEKKVCTSIAINDSKQRVLIGGTIDRLDLVGESAYILDYKTGKADLNFPVLKALFDKENKTRNKAAFQTLVYSLILHKNQPGFLTIYPGIYSLRGIFNENYNPSFCLKGAINAPLEFVTVSDQFEAQFIELLEEIFNVDSPFTQTTNPENCKYCPYRQICRK
jgi:ATP-dependent helicase/DNAse subunit B